MQLTLVVLMLSGLSVGLIPKIYRVQQVAVIYMVLLVFISSRIPSDECQKAQVLVWSIATLINNKAPYLFSNKLITTTTYWTQHSVDSVLASILESPQLSSTWKDRQSIYKHGAVHNCQKKRKKEIEPKQLLKIAKQTEQSPWENLPNPLYILQRIVSVSGL